MLSSPSPWLCARWSSTWWAVGCTSSEHIRWHSFVVDYIETMSNIIYASMISYPTVMGHEQGFMRPLWSLDSIWWSDELWAINLECTSSEHGQDPNTYDSWFWVCEPWFCTTVFQHFITLVSRYFAQMLNNLVVTIQMTSFAITLFRTSSSNFWLGIKFIVWKYTFFTDVIWMILNYSWGQNGLFMTFLGKLRRRTTKMNLAV